MPLFELLIGLIFALFSKFHSQKSHVTHNQLSIQFLISFFSLQPSFFSLHSSVVILHSSVFIHHSIQIVRVGFPHSLEEPFSSQYSSECPS